MYHVVNSCETIETYFGAKVNINSFQLIYDFDLA